jgi:hypothetical protein
LSTRRPVAIFALLYLLAAAASPWAAGQEEGSRPGAQPVVVLDTAGFWRMHHTLAPPVVAADGQLKPLLLGPEWLDSETPPPPPGWREPGFDDSGWLRIPARGGCLTPYLARQCLRGKFQVTDPAGVKGLSLSVEYHGGVVAYLNGREICRGHLPPGDPDGSMLAEPYPLEVYVDRNGDLIADDGTYTASGQRQAGRPDQDGLQRMAARVRSLKDVPLPQSALLKGVNVLAIELVRSPYHRIMLESESEAGGKRRRNKYDWCTCELVSVRLVAAGADGLVPNASRPAGFQVWNSDPMAADCSLDYGDPCELLRPISLVGARNGSFSGKVVVGSTKTISGLKAAASDLKGPGGSIPAAAIHIRYGSLWGEEMGLTYPDQPLQPPYPQWPGLLGAVVDSPPAEVPLGKVRPPLVAGAVIPVWVTVKVPREARAGTYTGQLTVQADGETPVAVPIRLDVADWALPDPQDYRTWVELIEAPDTLAVEYGQPLWSDKLFEMIGQAFQLMSDTGSRVLYVPAIAHTNLGNAESMIRWIKTGENRYDWDFSIMDRYLDLAMKFLGKPKIVVLQVWEVYMSSRESVGKRFGIELEERQRASAGGPLVTMLDPATGKTQNVALPRYTDPAMRPVWQALLNGVRQRLHQRGLEGALMLGMFTDAVPSKEDVQFFNEIAPDLAWVQEGHGRWNQKLHGIAEVGYQATVWGGFRFADGLRQTNQIQPPTVTSLYGWKEPRLDVVFERNTSLDTYPPSRWLFFPETAITGELRGIGRIGADYWRAVKDERGRRVGWVHDRFQEGRWGGSSILLNLCNPVLAPGEGGPVATNRLIALVEGIQECEARIFIERALTDEGSRAKLGEDLAKRAESVLDERLRFMWKTLSNYQLGGPMFFGATAWRWTAGIPGHRWFLGSGWQERSRALYAVAAEVADKLGER